MSATFYSSPTLAAWRHAAGADWTRYTNHAFVQGLGDGTLPQASFHYYLIQDYIFLIHFTRAWALAVVKSESLSEMRLAAATRSTPYQQWIDTYSGDEYQVLCTTLGDMIELAALSRIGPEPMASPRWTNLCKRFHMATKLEINFWAMGLRGHE